MATEREKNVKKNQLLFKVIAILIPSIFLFFIGNTWANSEPLKGWHEWESKDNVPLDKTWTIEFNQVVDEESIQGESIFIENAQLEKIENEISIDESGNKVVIKPPTEGYQSDETYTLYINSQISSYSESFLKQPIKMKFSTISTIPPFEPRDDSSNTVEVTEAVEEVAESSFLTIAESYVQLEEADAQQLETGDIFFLPATEESPFGQARKVTKKTNEDGIVTVHTEKPALEEIISDMDLSQTIPVSAEDFIINPELVDDSGEFQMASKNGCKKKGSIEICTTKNGDVSIKLKDLKLKEIHTALNGELELISPHVNVDIESKKFLGLPYKFEFNRIEFVAEEKLDFQLHSELSGAKSETIELASVPVPFAGFPKAGVNVVISLTVSANGKVSLDYSLEQSFSIKAGVKNNKDREKLEPFSDIDFTFNQDLDLQGEANLDIGLESGVYLLVGDISLVDLTVTVAAENELKGKMVDLSDNDEFNPSGCFRLDSQVYAIGEFSFGEEIDTKWFGKVGKEYQADLFNKKLFSGELGNCSYSSLQLIPKVKSLEPGKEGVFEVSGKVQNFDRTLKNLTIPSEYVTFTSKNTDLITINENGTYKVSPNAKHGDKATLKVVYTDPVNGKTVSKDLKIEIREQLLKFESDLLGYSMFVDSKALERMKVEERTVKGSEEQGQYLATAFFLPDEEIKKEDVFVGGILRYTHEQWENHFSTNPASSKIAETEHWIYAYNEPRESPYEGNFLWKLTSQANKYTSTQNKLKQATRTIKVFTEDVPDKPEEPVDEEEDQPGLIADLNLEKVIRKHINKPEGDITKEDMLRLTHFGISRYPEPIKNLSGIEHAINLEYLYIDSHEISDITPLSHLTNLNYLHLDFNEISDISPLSQLTNLETLELNGNQIRDLSPLSSLTNLEALYLMRNQISDLTPLSDLTNLKTLYLNINQISDLTALNRLTNLTTLNLTGNQISNIDTLKSLTSLVTLRLIDNQISNITALSILTSLEELSLDRNNVSDLSSLSRLTKLRELSLVENQISDVGPLGNLMNIDTINLSLNQISDVSPLGNLVNVKSLNLVMNQISDIVPLKNLTKLEQLFLGGNPIKDPTILHELQGKGIYVTHELVNRF